MALFVPPLAPDHDSVTLLSETVLPTEQEEGAPQAVVAGPMLSSVQVLLFVSVAVYHIAVINCTLTEAAPAVSWLT